MAPTPAPAIPATARRAAPSLGSVNAGALNNGSTGSDNSGGGGTVRSAPNVGALTRPAAAGGGGGGRQWRLAGDGRRERHH